MQKTLSEKTNSNENNDISYYNTENQLSDDSLITIYSQVGQIHNNGLEKIYDSLMVMNLAKEENQILYLSTDELNTMIVNYISATQPNLSGTYDYKDYYDQKVSDSIYSIHSFESYCEEVLGQQLGGDLAEAFSDLEGILRNQNTYTVTSKYDSIIASRTSLISDYEDKIAFISCASTVKGSYDYWSTNYAKWDSLGTSLHGGPNGLAYRNIPPWLRQILFADASGALAGAIRGGVFGSAFGTFVLPGGGTVAGGLAGAIVGGAASGSIASATNVLIQILE